MHTDEVLLEIRDLHKYFGDLEVLKGVSTDIHRGEVVAVVGLSGCGKSTFLRCLNLLEIPTSGTILFKGVNTMDGSMETTELREKIGMVFQSFNLFPNMTVKKNIMLAPLKLNIMSEDEASKKADELLDRVGLSDKADEYPSKLSGGQQQRVAIARAIATKPSLILADEPTGNLDSQTSEEIMQIFHELHRQGNTIVLITHDSEVAKQAERSINILDGRITEVKR